MKLIKELYESLRGCDLKLLVFSLAMITLMFSQSYIAEPIEEVEVEKTLVEELDTETEEKSSSKDTWEDEFFSYRNASSSLVYALNEGTYLIRDNKFSNSAHIIEIPVPPPEFFIL